MLVELGVHDLGVIESTRLVLGRGMTALTGETGAGKTMLVEAIELLVGARAEPHLVRPGADEAVVEGRFDLDGTEVVLTRVVPRRGRSRAYVDGRMATAGALAERGAALVDLHGQHDHQSLLSPAVQREALDRFGGVDLGPLFDARRALAAVETRLAELGGDAGARAREVDLLRFQAAELDGAAIEGPEEDQVLEAREELLADAVAHREAAAGAVEALTGDGGALDATSAALGALAGRGPFAAEEERLRAALAELSDLATSVRLLGEQIEEDPEGLDAVRTRRHQLQELVRKYGTASLDDRPRPAGGTLADVLAYRDQVGRRLAELEGHEQAAQQLEREREVLAGRVAEAAAVVGRSRRAAAPQLAGAVQAHLERLALGAARLDVVAGGDDPADDVRFLLAANPGTPLLPLTKVASGGELARTMLALRLVLTAGPPTLVFDEVDAGIGGTTALAVGRALAAVAEHRQVLVVTHLPQVAAFADAQVAVIKHQGARRTTAAAHVVEGSDRLVELSRMLSGQPDSAAAREHAAELLSVAAAERAR